MKQLFIILIATISSLAQADERPNIILLLADDLGWSALGCYGSTFYETPNLDRLADEGVRFTAAFSAAANCAPSRASLLSGQYTPKHRVMYVGPGDYQEKYKKSNGDLKKFPMIQPRGETELPARDTVENLAENLQASGYRTAMFGKWHLGRDENHPGQRGFDVAIESHGSHFGFHTDPEIDHPEGEYLSDFLSNQAVKFVNEGAVSDQPFFLYYADFLVHKPFEAKEAYLKHFSEKEPSETQQSPMGAAMIKSLDDSIGKILDALDESGQRENTLIVFTSDNGGLSYEEDGLREENTSNLPLRGRKGSEYDGGLRVPWIASWPGQFPEGVECDTPVHHVDLYTTFSAAAETATPPQDLHGTNLLTLFRDPSSGLKPRNLFWYLPGYSAFHTPSVMVRNDNWKLIRHLENEEHLLFDTDSDISESIDARSSNPELASDLNQATQDWLDELDAPRMTPNPEYEP